MPDARHPAVVLAPGAFATVHGKGAHGLVRHSARFRVVAVLDPAVAGRDAGEVLDGRPRGIPLVATLEEALRAVVPPTHAVVGLATHGGRFTPELRPLLLEAVRRGLHLVNGLHESTAEDAEIRAAARQSGATLLDLRRPKPLPELHFWTGAVLDLKVPRVAVLGTDCALGKRTTTVLLVEALRAAGLRAEMIYTGQTGWMQGARFGFILDSTLNDYVSGELEHALLTCAREAEPEVILIEGQSALRNPSGPCGAELLVSGGARGVVLQHAPGRAYYEGYEDRGLRIPDVREELRLLPFYGARALGLTLNAQGLAAAELHRVQAELEGELALPVVCPLEEGVERLVPVLCAYVERERR